MFRFTFIKASKNFSHRNHNVKTIAQPEKIAPATK